MPQPSLRQRKKAAAMHHIQVTAMDLFERDGFDAVTIEQVAQAAEVSPSTVYRYFGTKEGLALHDEFDEAAMDGLVAAVAAGGDPARVLRDLLERVSREHIDPGDEDLTRRRTRLWFATPAIRHAGLELVDDVIDQLAVRLTQVVDVDVPQARLALSVVVWPLLTAIRSWHEEGAPAGRWRVHVDQALAVVPEHIPGWPSA